MQDDHDNLDDVIIPNYPCPRARCSIEEWEAEASSLEHLKDSGWTAIGLLSADARCRWNMAQQESPGRFAGAEAATELVEKGASFDEAARILGTSPYSVAECFAQAGEHIGKFLSADRILRAEGPPSDYVTLAERTGLTVSQITKLCHRLGFVSTTGRRLAAGGGFKYGPEVYDEIRRLKEVEGWSNKRIGLHLNIERTTVARMCLRRGFVKGAGMAEKVAS